MHILEGFVLCDDNTFNFVIGDDKKLYIRCLDVGKYLNSTNVSNGSRDHKKFVVNSRERKYFEFETMKRILMGMKTNKSQKEAFIVRMNNAFFGPQKRKFFFPRDSRKIKVTCMGESATVKVDKENKIQFEEALEKYENFRVILTTFFECLMPDNNTEVEDKEPASRPTNGFVYILKDISKNRGVYKVGKATNLAQRLSTYSTGSSEKQEFERTFEAENCDLFEKCMHHMFSGMRMGRSEMFKVPIQALEIAADLVKCLDEVKRLNEKHILSEGFDQKAYAKEFENILMAREAYRNQREHSTAHELSVKKILANIELVKKFVRENGRMPEKSTDKKLYWFVVRLRLKYSGRRVVAVDKRIVRAAETIPGWVWDLRETKFDVLCMDIDKWFGKHQCQLTVEKNKNLYERLNTWKKSYRLSSGEKEAEYDELKKIFFSHGQEFIHNPQEEEFLGKVEALKCWMDDNGGHFPSVAQKPLGTWLSEQRKRVAGGKALSPEKLEIMNTMFPGWNENQNDKKWRDSVKKNKEYLDIHGHLISKRADAFLQNQRSQAKLETPKKARQLTIEREKILDEMFPNWRNPLCEEEKEGRRNCPICNASTPKDL